MMSRQAMRKTKHDVRCYRGVNRGGTFGSLPLCRGIDLVTAATVDEIDVRRHGSARVQVFRYFQLLQFPNLVESDGELAPRELKRTELVLPERLWLPGEF